MGKNISINVAKMKTKGKGVFDMGELYQNMKFWLDFQGYGDHEKTFKEEKYVERIKGDSKQIEIRWRAEKEVNEYVSYVINVSFFILGLKSAEIEKDGKKIGTQKGEVEMRFGADVILDRKGTWNPFFRSIYNKFIIPERIDAHKTELYDKVYTFYNEVKSYLDIRST